MRKYRIRLEPYMRASKWQMTLLYRVINWLYRIPHYRTLVSEGIRRSEGGVVKMNKSTVTFNELAP